MLVELLNFLLLLRYLVKQQNRILVVYLLNIQCLLHSHCISPVLTSLSDKRYTACLFIKHTDFCRKSYKLNERKFLESSFEEMLHLAEQDLIKATTTTLLHKWHMFHYIYTVFHEIEMPLYFGYNFSMFWSILMNVI